MRQPNFLWLVSRSAGTLLVLASSAGVMADTLYKCVEPSGSVLYTNQKGSAKNCTILSRELPITTFSAPPPRAVGASRPASVNPSPAGFPRVDSETQRGRDNDRRRILEQELTTEQQNLERARKALNEGETAGVAPQKLQDLREGVTVHERNIEALKRELANIK